MSSTTIEIFHVQYYMDGKNGVHTPNNKKYQIHILVNTV